MTSPERALAMLQWCAVYLLFWCKTSTNVQILTPGALRAKGLWWTRRRVGEYLPPLSLDNPSLEQFMRDHAIKVLSLLALPIQN
jgi:hypothetical protein